MRQETHVLKSQDIAKNIQIFLLLYKLYKMCFKITYIKF